MSKKPILFCTQCGAPVERKIPEGDDHERYVCTACGEIFYENPLNIVGTLPVWEDRVTVSLNLTFIFRKGLSAMISVSSK